MKMRPIKITLVGTCWVISKEIYYRRLILYQKLLVFMTHYVNMVIRLLIDYSEFLTLNGEWVDDLIEPICRPEL